MIRMTGAQIIIHLLERQGIRIISGIPGGANLPMYDALSQSRVIRHVLARHEQGAGFIAQGMARVTGTPQVCFATSGPGATNVLTAVADAKLDSIPMVCITGQVPSTLIGTDAFQEVDTYGMSMPVTKHNFLVKSAAELLEVIPERVSHCGIGKTGAGAGRCHERRADRDWWSSNRGPSRVAGRRTRSYAKRTSRKPRR